MAKPLAACAVGRPGSDRGLPQIASSRCCSVGGEIVEQHGSDVADETTSVLGGGAGELRSIVTFDRRAPTGRLELGVDAASLPDRGPSCPHRWRRP